MPINGKSDVIRLDRAGYFRLGEARDKAPPGKHPPKIDYFRCVCDDPALLAAVEKKYGPKPKTLNVMFPTNDLDSVWDESLKYYVTTKKGGWLLICKGDGITENRRHRGKEGMQ
jgi:hypothetical protein